MKNLTFKIKDLGIIKNAELKHKPLTIFCGPNNSGKTWTMYALYHFYTFSRKGLINFNCVNNLSEDDLLDFDITQFIKKNKSSIIDTFHNEVSRSMPEFFNSSKDIFQNFEITSLSSFEITNEPKSLWSDNSKNLKYKKHLLMHHISDMLFNFNDVFLMPAERNGLHLFYRELSSRRTALLHHASKKDINLRELLHDVMHSRYAKPIADYIDWLNNRDDYAKNIGEFSQFAKQIEKDFAGGVYKVDSSTDAIFFKPYKKRTQEQTPVMELHITSGAIKSLFGLWFYLKYQAEKNDIVMIDEPELNIHPENQRKLARLLAQLVNAGLRVMISTHSDYMIREFNTLIMLNGHNDLQKKQKYKENEAIDCEKVGAYLFDNNTIKPFEIKPNDGIYATTFDEVIENLNKVNNDIYYTLQDAKNE